ncbi:MAG: SDR family NAD(P)-dependent oxidoreductase [Candidatus Melainabacteria bacterium]|nr:SDR family NAD(P)-dependent oxidoreductase [Candidatus Melainabacteria bacterium]
MKPTNMSPPTYNPSAKIHGASAATTPSFEGQTFLVTGGAGFIGSHTVRALLQQGASVVALDNFDPFYDPAIKHQNLAPFAQHPRFELWQQDLQNVAALEQLFQAHGRAFQSGGIIHLAALAGVRPSLANPAAYLETNVQATLALLECAKSYEVARIVFASSSSVYGDCPDQAPFDENLPIQRPISPYAATKVMAESLLHTYHHLYGLQVAILRFFTVYGPGQRPDLAIHKFTRLIDEGRAIPVYGAGHTERDYTYIDDVIQGVLAALRYTEEPFDIFNLGENQTVALRQLIHLIENALGKTALLDYQPAQPGDVRVTCANIEKAQRLLGYRPTTKIAEGIPKFVAWYQQMKEKTNGIHSLGAEPDTLSAVNLK